MHLSRPLTSRTKLVTLAFMVSALAVSLGSGAAVNAHPGPSRHGPPSGSTCVGNSKYCWFVGTVDYSSKDYNYVTGIEDDYHIVGAYSTNNIIFSGFYASPNPEPTTYARPFISETDEPYVSTFLDGLSNNNSLGGTFQVGYASNGCASCTTVGVILNGGSWATVQDPSAGLCGGTHVLAMNDTQQGVGYYLKPTTAGNCEPQAFEFYPNPSGGYQYYDFSPSPPPGTGSQSVISSTASGINTLGDVVGTVTYGSPAREAYWFYSELKYYAFQYTTSTSKTYNTYGNGINYNDGVVGDYVDGSGATHGFFVFNPANPSPVSIDYPGSGSGSKPYTIINSINTDWAIAGWYKDSTGKTHGFVGICDKPDGKCPHVPAPQIRKRRTPTDIHK